jgi:hypothetical protein
MLSSTSHIFPAGLPVLLDLQSCPSDGCLRVEQHRHSIERAMVHHTIVSKHQRVQLYPHLECVASSYGSQVQQAVYIFINTSRAVRVELKNPHASCQGTVGMHLGYFIANR